VLGVIKPAFGPVQLAGIQTERLQRFISTVPTGAPNIHNIVKCLRAVWKSARAWGYASHNPFDGLVMPTIEKSEQPFFTYAEVCQILAAAPEPDKTLYWLLAQTGLRIGEVLALTWETVDLENSIIQVRGTVARSKVREYKTKTKAAKRLIPLSPRLQEHLSVFRTRLWRENSLGLLFANSVGKPHSADNFLIYRLQPLLETLKLETAGFHAFRHASATILSLMKVPMEIRLARMGHMEEEMTLKYTHVIDAAAREVARGFDQLLLPERAANG
jgi:integrase